MPYFFLILYAVNLGVTSQKDSTLRNKYGRNKGKDYFPPEYSEYVWPHLERLTNLKLMFIELDVETHSEPSFEVFMTF